jgi:hypothetical protein
MKLIIFSLQVDFLTPKVFCGSAARKLARLLSGSDILAVQMLIRVWIPSPQKRALAKIDISLKNHQFHC